MSDKLLLGLLMGVVCIAGIMFYVSTSSDKNSFNIQRDFNAIGDGVHDDTKSIQNALDTVPNGSTITFPNGVYKVSDILKHEVTTGYGTSFSALKINKPLTLILNEAILITETEKEYGVFWIYNTTNVSIIGGTLLGDSIPSDGSYTSRVGVLIQNSSNCILNGLKTRNFTQGINLYYSKDCILQNVSAENNMASGIISFRSEGNLFESCFVRNSGDGHLSLYGGGRNNKIIDCIVVEDRKDHTSEQGITVESEKDSFIENTTVTGFYYGIDIKNGSENITVQENQSTNNQFNIVIRAGDPNNLQTTSNNIKIINNNVLDVRKGEQNGGIMISIGNDHLVEGNTISQNRLIVKSNIINENKDSLGVKIDKNNFIIP